MWTFVRVFGNLGPRRFRGRVGRIAGRGVD